MGGDRVVVVVVTKVKVKVKDQDIWYPPDVTQWRHTF